MTISFKELFETLVLTYLTWYSKFIYY